MTKLIKENHYEQMDIFDFLGQNKSSESSTVTITKPVKEVRKQESSEVTPESLSSLMKKKYGISKAGKLLIKPTDDVYTIFKKTAMYIYKNRNWNNIEMIEAADILYPFLGFTDFSNQTTPISKPVSVISQFIPKEDILKLHLQGSKRASYNYVLGFGQFEPTKKHAQHYLIVTDDYAYASKTTVLYTIRGNKSYDFTFIGKPLLLGYSKLVADIMNQFRRDEDKKRPTELDLANLLKGLISGKKSNAYLNYERIHQNYFQDLSQEDIEHYIDVLKLSGILNYKKDTSYPYVEDYLKETYNMVLMQEQESNLTGMTHARSWETKKNVNQETQHIAFTTPLNNEFNRVEIDNDVDLSKFSVFEKETLRVLNWLPKGHRKPTLRLRKIANHHALGMYVPAVNNIVIDFRDSKDRSNMTRPGISSFLHEYGHYLDYQFLSTESNKIELPLSMQDDFSEILKRVSRNIDCLPIDSYVRSKESYYRVPTEIFARAFEIYLNSLGVESPLLVSSSGITSLDEYQVVKMGNEDLINKYFDNLFISLKKDVFNQTQAIAAKK